MFILTSFNAKKTKAKDPISPYGNRTYKFRNIHCLTLEECVLALSDNWILSNAVDIENDNIYYRNKEDLSHLRLKDNNLMVLDLDKISDSDAYYKVRDYFRDEEFTCVLAKSKSFNGVDNFNLKGFLVINTENTRDNIRKHVNFLQDHLGDLCEVDATVKNDVSYHAPTYQTDIVYLNEGGTNFVDINYCSPHKEVKHTEIIADSKMLYKCMEIYSNLGYTLLSKSLNPNGSANWSHFSEKRTTGGFFMFINRPFIMHHHNETRTISIWNLFKKTDEGKEYLKSLFKKQQEDNIIDADTYDNLVTLNDRFIDVEKCSDIIDDFLETSNSVLKIKSAMGTGKSLVIDKIIEKTDERVLIISNRISVAMDYSKKYNIKTYLDKGDDSWVEGENLIVQYDSLHKYKLKDFDIIILDEFMSLLFQSRSELSKENKNFNLSKFYSVLRGSRKVVIADAFLNGYENSILKKKFMFYIRNDYRDNVTHYNYKHREMFFSSLVQVLTHKGPGESVTVSVMSNNALNAMEKKLTEMGFNVATLTAGTPDLRKKKIYEIFEQDTAPWDVILYSPTLTVGVSNMNNVIHHYHFDTGLSADVISSLQMVKRSRRSTILHTFLKETQRYNPTTGDDLDILSNSDIVNYFNGRQTTLLIDTDEDGDFRLSELGKFSNKIEALFNIFENNHSNAFKILMGEQFNYNTTEVTTNDNEYSFYNMIKDHKEELKELTIKMIEEHKDCDYSEEHISELRMKTIDLNEEEKTALILGSVKDKFKNISRKDLIKIAELDVETNGKFLRELYFLKEASMSQEDVQKKLSFLIANSVNSIQNKDIITFYSYLNALNLTKLNQWYSENDINAVDAKINQGKRFKAFLKKLGYKSKNGRMSLSQEHVKFFKEINN